MRGIVRLNDVCTGHGCFPPRRNISASNDVFVNSLGVHRQNDVWTTHCCRRSCHDGYTVSGSASIFANGLQVARKDDPINCGSRCNTCSDNVFSG